jgi:hypothetical protein
MVSLPEEKLALEEHKLLPTCKTITKSQKNVTPIIIVYIKILRHLKDNEIFCLMG